MADESLIFETLPDNDLGVLNALVNTSINGVALNSLHDMVQKLTGDMNLDELTGIVDRLVAQNFISTESNEGVTIVSMSMRWREIFLGDFFGFSKSKVREMLEHVHNQKEV